MGTLKWCCPIQEKSGPSEFLGTRELRRLQRSRFKFRSFVSSQVDTIAEDSSALPRNRRSFIGQSEKSQKIHRPFREIEEASSDSPRNRRRSVGPSEKSQKIRRSSQEIEEDSSDSPRNRRKFVGFSEKSPKILD